MKQLSEAEEQRGPLADPKPCKVGPDCRQRCKKEIAKTFICIKLSADVLKKQRQKENRDCPPFEGKCGLWSAKERRRTGARLGLFLFL